MAVNPERKRTIETIAGLISDGKIFSTNFELINLPGINLADAFAISQYVQSIIRSRIRVVEKLYVLADSKPYLNGDIFGGQDDELAEDRKSWAKGEK